MYIGRNTTAWLVYSLAAIFSFAQVMESFFSMKQPNNADLHALMPTVVYMHAPDQVGCVSAMLINGS